jgi:hypothetical protein
LTARLSRDILIQAAKLAVDQMVLIPTTGSLEDSAHAGPFSTTSASFQNLVNRHPQILRMMKLHQFYSYPSLKVVVA